MPLKYKPTSSFLLAHPTPKSELQNDTSTKLDTGQGGFRIRDLVRLENVECGILSTAGISLAQVF